MNKVILMGRLVKNPEVRQDANGAISMARYSLAVDRIRTKNNEDPGADFINCVVFSYGAGCLSADGYEDFMKFNDAVDGGKYFKSHDYRQRVRDRGIWSV